MTQWQKVRIGDLFNLEKGSLQSSKCTSGKYDFLTAGKYWKTHNEYTHKCEALIIAVAASGSLGRTHYIKGKFVSSDLCFILTPKNEQKYPLNLSFYHFLFNSLRKILVAATKSGTSKEAINQKNLKKYEIPYFDIKQQNFWIEKLKNTQIQKELLNKELVQQQALLKKLRQQILQEAIEGKLTQDWREKNPNTEPAIELLKRIQAEKQQLIKDKKIKAQKPLPAISEDEKPFKLPDSWAWCRLGKLLNIKSGKRIHASDYKKSGVPFLRSGEIGALGRGENIKAPLFISHEKYSLIKNKFGIPKQGDILIACIGGSIGNTWIVDKRKFYFKDGNLVLIESIPEIMTRYLLIYLLSIYFWNNTILNATDSSYNALTIVKLKEASFTVPPLAEQKAIVAKVEKLLSICDKLQIKINDNQTYAEQLMQAVLKEAFTQSPRLIEAQQPEKQAFVKRKIMAAYIINQSLEDENFGDVKFEKILYLSDCLLQRDFNQRYYQKAAGPYDNKFTYSFFDQVQKSKWFKKQKNGAVNRIMAGENVVRSKKTYNYFSTEELDKIDRIIQLFKKTSYQQPEIVATLYAVWNNRIINQQPIDDELLKADFLAWDKQKIKYKGRIFGALDWMRKENIIPNGWGKLINKPKSD